MEIVINIPNKAYQLLKDKGVDWLGAEHILNAVANGTPLPKGHGRLIDADELKSLSYEILVDNNNPIRLDGLSSCNGLVEDDIDDAPTIIEADKESAGK